MAISDDIQHLIIEMDEHNKLMELLWLAFQQPTVTMEYAISSMCVLRKQVDVMEEQLQTLLVAVEKMELENEIEYKP